MYTNKEIFLSSLKVCNYIAKFQKTAAEDNACFFKAYFYVPFISPY